jgi:hypothetical protein
MVSLSAAKSVPPTPDSRALGRAAQQRERERAARKREHARRPRERRERRNEEYLLREQQGLSSPGTEEYSSSEEDEVEEAGGQVLTVKIRQPSHEFTFGVGMSFIPYPLVLTPVV